MKIKPIRKFNNGNGALLCNTCSKIIATGEDAWNGYKLYCDEHFKCDNIKREGESCTLNNKCTYPKCNKLKQ